jgi:protein-S-isoprenylcysteine O-methyltransferase Ste14
VPRVLAIVGWIGCSIYATIPLFWFLIHPNIGYWRSRKRSPHWVLLPAWIALWMIFIAVTARWHNEVLYRSALAWIPAVALIVVGFGLYLQSGKHFSGRQLRGDPELRAAHPQNLVTVGIRARIRHPIYLGHLCEMLGWSVGTGLLVCYGLTGFAVLAGAWMILTEERELERRFGQAYQEYKSSVPAILPRPAATKSNASRRI